MDAAIKKQMATAGYIDRFWDNLIKAGKEKMTRAYLTARLELLESYWSKFFAVHDDLVVLDKIETTDYMKVDVYTSTEESYLNIKTRIRSVLQGAVDSTPSGNLETTSVLRQIQLPKINLPSFNGEQLAWEGFRDLFKSLMHEAESITPIQKLQYLKSSLIGEAATVISSIGMSSEGYAMAWEELVTRYDNRRVLLATHMRALLSSAPITKASAGEINRLISTVNQAACSFRALGRPVDQWSDWFVHIMVDKLDPSSRLLWESSQESSHEFPTFDELKTFLLTRARALDAAQPHSCAVAASTKPKRNGRRDDVSSHAATMSDGYQCPICKTLHPLRFCSRFKALSTKQRREQVRKSRACYNCLSQSHSSAACPSIYRCRTCQEKHHTLMHLGASEKAVKSATTPLRSNSVSASADNSDTTAEGTKVAALSSFISGPVLLATAVVTLISESGRTLKVRALLDSGSEASFISERAAQHLRLRRHKVNLTVSGLQGVTIGKVSQVASLMIGSERSLSLRIALPKALIVSKLTQLIPSHQVSRSYWPHLQGLQLADPGYDKPSTVDAILGADVYVLLMEGDIRRGSPGQPAAHSTVFGWVLMGTLASADSISSGKVRTHHLTVLPDLKEELQRFWELEEFSEDHILTPEETYCKQLFMRSHTRDFDGRYTVRLPRRDTSFDRLGDSYTGAVRLLLATENCLNRNPSLKSAYIDFMNAYSALGHMEPVTENVGPNDDVYYLPHHAVMKSSNPEGKIRVVFNASFCTTTGLSLNDLLLSGPRLQSDLWFIWTRW